MLPLRTAKCSLPGEADLGFTLSIQECHNALVAELLLLCKAGDGADMTCSSMN